MDCSPGGNLLRIFVARLRRCDAAAGHRSQLDLTYLPGLCQGQLGDDKHVIGRLVGTKAASAAREDIRAAQPLTLLRDNESYDPLSRDRVGNTHDGRRAHRRIREKDVLHGSGNYLRPATNDQITTAADDVNGTTAVNHGQVAGTEPAVRGQAGGRLPSVSARRGLIGAIAGR